MRRVKGLLLAFVAVSALAGAVAASASASGPTLLLLGSELTVLINTTLNEPNTILGEIENTVAPALHSSGALFEATALINGGLFHGEYLALFLHVERTNSKNEAETCNTAGDHEGEVLLPTNTVKIVYDSLSPLGVGPLFSAKEFEIKCFLKGVESVKTKAKGNALGLVTPINTEVKGSESDITGSLRCSTTAGKPSETKYWNNEGKEETARFETNNGGGFEQACLLLELTSTGTVKLTPTTMVEMMG